MNASICPLCGQANSCVMATDSADPGKTCWCKSEVIPQRLLDQVPDAAKNRCCICINCLQSFKKMGGK